MKNIGMLYERLLETFSRIHIIRPKGSCIVMEKNWEDIDFQFNYWKMAGTTVKENFEFKTKNLDNEGLTQVL